MANWRECMRIASAVCMPCAPPDLISMRWDHPPAYIWVSQGLLQTMQAGESTIVLLPDETSLRVADISVINIQCLRVIHSRLEAKIGLMRLVSARERILSSVHGI